MIASENQGAWVRGATSHFADANGLRMHYVACGPEDGVPVLLLHGFPEFWYSWRHQMPALAAAGWRAIVPDQRGYNLTEQRRPYNLETLVGDLGGLLDDLHVPRAHVVGHDWGGVTAWGFASYFPDRVLSLTAMNSPHPLAYLDAIGSFSAQIFRSWYILFFQIPRLPEALFRARNHDALRRLYAEVPREYMTPEDIARYVAACSRPGAMTAMINWYRALPGEMRRTGGALPSREIGCPVLVIWGEPDFALGRVCNRTLPRYVPNLRVEYLPGTSHWVQMHAPEEVNRRLLGFLASVRGGTPD
jgi:pimeloyl-ACP methyl ester carboxylesterase